jgi:hypothetical protein
VNLNSPDVVAPAPPGNPANLVLQVTVNLFARSETTRVGTTGGATSPDLAFRGAIGGTTTVRAVLATLGGLPAGSPFKWY